MEDSFLKELITHLAFITKVKYVFIAESGHDEGSDFIETITLWSHGKIVENIKFSLKGTPCEKVLDGNISFYSQQVQKLFPEDNELKSMNAESYLGCPMFSLSGHSLGYIAILDTIPMVNERELTTIVQAFAALASSEFERVQMQQKLVEREAFNNTILENSLDAFIAINTARKIIRWNKSAEKIFGWSENEVEGRLLEKFIVPKGKKTAHRNGIDRVVETGKTHILNQRIEINAQHREGHTFPVELTITPVYSGDEIISFSAFIHDITERKHAEESLRNKNLTLKALNLCNHELLHANDMQGLLDAVCKIIVEIGGYQTAGIGFADQNENKAVRFVAMYGDKNDYLSKANVNWRDNNSRGRGPVGVAIRTGKPHIIHDMKIEPSFTPWRKAALENGYASNVAIPLIINKLVMGVLIVYSSEKNDFDNERLELLDSLANNVAYGLLVLRIKDEQSKSKDDLLQSENRFRTLYDGTPAIFFTINKDYSIASVNIFGAEKLGYRVEDLVGQSTMEIILPEDKEKYIDHIDSCFRDPENTHNWEIRKVKFHGSMIWSRESARVIDDMDGTQKILIVSEDITEAHKLSQQLSYQASHDALTGLVNRREFEIRLERLIQDNVGNGENHALCYLDLDQFKIINDTCGHLAGDELLRQLGELFKSKVRKKDTLARLGGDEFGVLMESCTLEQANRVAQNLRELVEEFQFVWTDKRFLIGVSIGLVPINDKGVDSGDILSAADAACYAAKDAGRNRVHVYHVEDIDLAVHRGEMQWVSKINYALAEDRLRLYIQPIVSLKDNDSENKHYECLIRMVDEDGSIILPGAFLPAAERYDLSIKLDRWVFDSTYAWMENLSGKRKRLTSCSINLSGHSLSDEEFLNYIVGKLHVGNVPTSNICFEITETVAISRLSNAIKFIDVVKKKGCFFALDDFGSGVSSFGYLKNLPVDFIKIDGMFVRDMIDDPIDFAMVRSINEIGHVMGKKTIAEFVENEEILECLTKLGVDYAQGYHTGKPRAIKVPLIKGENQEDTGKKPTPKHKRYRRTRKTD